MAFTNDTGYPVLIKGINQRGKVIFEVCGIDDGRTVELSEPARREHRRGRGVARVLRRAWRRSARASRTATTRSTHGSRAPSATPGQHNSRGHVLLALQEARRRSRWSADTRAIHRPERASNPSNIERPTIRARTRIRNPGALTANFTPSRDGDGTRITFIKRRPTNAVSFAWAFGDGGTADGKNPTHIYADFGSYRVTLTVTDANGNTTSRAKRIDITAPTTEETPPPA